MATRRALPVELMLHVLGYIEDSQQLGRLSLVSRRVHRLVEPFLYRDVFLDSKARIPALHGRHHGEDFFRSLRQFTRTIVTRPKLGTYVKTLSLSCVWDVVDCYEALEECRRSNLAMDLAEEGQEDEALAELTDAMMQGGMEPDLRVEIQEDLGLIARAADRRGLRNGLMLNGGCRGIAIILLHHLPNLRALSMKGSSTLATIAFSCFGSMEGGIPAGLCSITELTMAPSHPGVHLDAEAIIPFMCLPKLHTYNITGFATLDFCPDDHPFVRVGCLEEWDRWAETRGVCKRVLDDSGEKRTQPFPLLYSWVMSPGCSSVTALRIADSAIGPSLLERLLALSPHLEECVYQYSYDAAGDDSGHCLIPSALASGLQGQASSLRQFTLDVDSRGCVLGRWYSWDVDGTVEVFGSLSFLRRLEVLDVHLDFLMTPNHIASFARNSEGQHRHNMFPRSNPLDSLLPTSLKILRLKADPRPSSLRATGLPFTLGRTCQALPSLAVLHVLDNGLLGSYSWDDDELHGESIRLARDEIKTMVLGDFDFRLFDLTR